MVSFENEPHNHSCVNLDKNADFGSFPQCAMVKQGLSKSHNIYGSFGSCNSRFLRQKETANHKNKVNNKIITQANIPQVNTLSTDISAGNSKNISQLSHKLMTTKAMLKQDIVCLPNTITKTVLQSELPINKNSNVSLKGNIGLTQKKNFNGPEW